MDKSDGNKKRTQAGASRRAYSLFGGIINLAQSHVTKANNATSSNVNAGTTQDPQGSSNVYTVTVNNNQIPDSNANQVKTYENIASMKKKKGDQSPSTVSSLTSSCGMSNITTTTSPIGPAPRTVSILTALNELAISDEKAGSNHLNSSTLSPSRNRNSSNSTSKSNPTNSSYHHPSKRNSRVSSNTHSTSEQVQHEISTKAASSASLHHSSSSIYHSATKGAFANQQSANNTNSYLKGYNEPRRNVMSASANTLPSSLRVSHNSPGDHKESLARKSTAKQRDRSKSRTPDWIWKIFQLTKHGKLEELQQSLLGLDSTLIRHLADAKGNTVLHSAARGGHVNTLQWLVSVLGPQCTEAALHDHNQAGRTVILTALKKGQLQCLQWLVQHTKAGEKAVVPNEGERSLLHFAATYGDINVVKWLCTELIERGIPVDIRDAGGMTPLHDAAKSGQMMVCHELILAGADPLAQTELGWRPSDLAIRHRHMECASYFMVAEAAGSLGNQLHSLLLAFNHLRQQHEELRSHFRETLRVGKWLAKERNDLIKHFPSKWAQDDTSSLLLGGTSNGTRFSDLEHKLVVAEQAWKKISPNNDVTGETVLSGEEALVSNMSSHDFLQRLAAVQLRHERNQSVGSSLSGSSDEDHCEESSSSDASSSDVDAERVTSVTAGSGAGANTADIIYSSNVPPHQMERITMKTRSKAAPWLLPPNDVFLSQLSPFVGAHGKSLPTLDLVHGAPTTTTMLSPIMTPSSAPTTSVTTPASTTELAGENEKSVAQIDVERHRGNQGKRDSTSLEISVLEVIEPSSPASPASSKKRREDGVEPFHVSSRPWLDFSDQTKGMLRSLPTSCAVSNPSFGIRGGGGDSCSSGSGRQSVLVVKASGTPEVSSVDGCSGSEGRSLTSQRHADQHDGQLLPNSVNQAPDLICGTNYRTRVESHSKLHSQTSREFQQAKDYFTQRSRVQDQIHKPMSIHQQRLFSSSDELSRVQDVDISENISENRIKDETSTSLRVMEDDSKELKDYALHPPSNSNLEDATTANENMCMTVEASRRDEVAGNSINSSVMGNNDNRSYAENSTNSHSLKARSPSPKSYVSKLTVIPVEATTETCFLSMRSTSFVREDRHRQQGGGGSYRSPHLPAESQDELSLGLSCQFPSDSVSSSNTPVMPRFNSSGTVVFPPRKPDWCSTELLSLTTPDSSLAGRLSPTPSEASRTESALAPPPSYVSHASQNSEVSKTESARGQTSEGGGERDLESPGVERNYINDSSHCECIPTPSLLPEQRSQNIESVTGEDEVENTDSSEICASGNNKSTDHSRSKKDDDDGDNDETTMKHRGIFGNQRIQASTCFIRSHLSTGIHKAGAQRLPKGLRGQSKPWYEIEGSDDEGSLLRVAKSKPSHSSRCSTLSSSATSDQREEESSETEPEKSNNSENNDNGEVQATKTQQNSRNNCQTFL